MKIVQCHVFITFEFIILNSQEKIYNNIMLLQRLFLASDDGASHTEL